MSFCSPIQYLSHILYSGHTRVIVLGYASIVDEILKDKSDNLQSMKISLSSCHDDYLKHSTKSQLQFSTEVLNHPFPLHDEFFHHWPINYFLGDILWKIIAAHLIVPVI